MPRIRSCTGPLWRWEPAIVLVAAEDSLEQAFDFLFCLFPHALGTLVAENSVVGISALQSSKLSETGAIIAANKKETEDADSEFQAGFGDGIWAVDSNLLSIENTVIRAHDRAGVVLLDIAPSQLTLKGLAFSSNL